jgi:hypothetical protein
MPHAEDAGRPPLDPEALGERVAEMVWDSHPMAHDMEGEDGEEAEPGVSWSDVQEWEGMDDRVFACRHVAKRIHDLYAAALREREEALLDVDRFSNPLAPYWWRKKYDRLMRTIRANTPTPEVPHAD